MFSNLEMVTSMFEKLDFQVPRRADLSVNRMLQRWHAETCEQIQERWETLMPNPFSIRPLEITPFVERQALLKLPRESIGVSIMLDDGQVPTMLACSRRLARTLIENVLNISGTDWPQTLPFSPGETAILEILFENSMEAISESWPGSATIHCSSLELIANPARTRLFLPGSDLFIANIEITTGYGVEQIYWLLPKKPIEALVAAEQSQNQFQRGQRKQAMTTLAERIPAQVVVELGRAEIKMSQIGALALGDVVMLDQSVFKPLTARIDQLPKWKVNPVTIGPRIGINIEQFIDD